MEKITLQIGIYNEKNSDLDNKSEFKSYNFNSIEEAISYVEFISLGYNFFKDGKSLVVRLEEASQVFLIDYDSRIPILELKKDLKLKYNNQNKQIDEKERNSQSLYKTEEKKANTNFEFPEDETVKYAKTSTGEKLPFKLFNPSDSESRSNLLWETQNSEQSTDFALIERRFSKNNSLKFFGTERIKSYNDIAFLFKSLEDESVEHAFLVYHFENKDYFVQHISSGTFDATIVDNRSVIANILEARPIAVTLVHNHPSGNLKASKADAECILNLKKALKYTDVQVFKGVIINLRSGKYLVFDEKKSEEIKTLKKQKSNLIDIQAYSFSKQILVKNFQPIKVSSSKEVAEFITTQKFGVADKTEMLILNPKMNIVGKFLMPPNSQVEFIIEKVTKFGGSNCIIYGNNISKEQINFYNERLRHVRMNILDGILFKSENGRKIFESFQDLGLLDNEKILVESPYVINDSEYKYVNNSKMSSNLSLSEQNIPVLLEIFINGTENKFSNAIEGIEFFAKIDINEKSNVSIKNNLTDFSTKVNNNAEKFKILSDFWAKELSYRTDLSKGLSNTQIDEKQAEYYRNYETSAKKLGISITPFIENSIGNKEDFRKVLESSFSQNDYEKILNNYKKTLDYSSPYALIKADDYLEAKLPNASLQDFEKFKNLFVNAAMSENKVKKEFSQRFGMYETTSNLNFYDRFKLSDNLVDFKIVAKISKENLSKTEILDYAYNSNNLKELKEFINIKKDYFLESASAEKKIQANQDENPLLSFGRDSQYIDDIMDDIENGNGDLWKKEKYQELNEKNIYESPIENQRWSEHYQEEMDATSQGFSFDDVFDQNFNDLKEEKINSNEIIGKITFHEGVEIMEYTSKEEYLSALKTEFESLGIGAFEYETILRDPELLKKVDDIVYGEYGEDNPNSLDFYTEKIKQEAFKENNIEEIMKNRFSQFLSSPKDFEIVEQYTKTLVEDFDNFFADKSTYKEKEKYEEIKKKYSSAALEPDGPTIISLGKRIKDIQEIVDKNTYAQGGSPDKIQIDAFLNVLSELKSEENLNNVIGGKIKDIAAEAIRNPESLKKYDQNTQDVINLYINQNPNIMEISTTKDKKEQELEVGRFANIKDSDGKINFKGNIEKIEGNNITLKNSKGETKTVAKEEVYQYFFGQKFDLSEVKDMLTSKKLPAGLELKDFSTKDLTQLMKGEQTETLFKGTKQEEGKELKEYEFKLIPRYSKEADRVVPEPEFKRQDFNIKESPIFGRNLSEEDREKLSKGEKLTLTASKEGSKDVHFKIAYDEKLNNVITLGFVNKKEEKQDLKQDSKKQVKEKNNKSQKI